MKSRDYGYCSTNVGQRLAQQRYFNFSNARAFKASSTCCAGFDCDENVSRTTPARSITKVTRPGITPKVFFTPYNFRTLPPLSLSSVKGNLYFETNAPC